MFNQIVNSFFFGRRLAQVRLSLGQSNDHVQTVLQIFDSLVLLLNQLLQRLIFRPQRGDILIDDSAVYIIVITMDMRRNFYVSISFNLKDVIHTATNNVANFAEFARLHVFMHQAIEIAFCLRTMTVIFLN